MTVQRRLIAFIFALLIGAVSSLPAAPRQDAEVVLDFWNYLVFDPPKTAIEELVDRFNEEHPTIHVKLLHVPQMEQKLLTATVGRVPPDVAIFDRFRTAGYADRGAFLTLDEMANEVGIDRDDFFEAPWEEGIYQGKLYAIPFQTDVRVLYYNKDRFREAGLDPERPPKNWQELREYSQKLTKRNDKGELVQVGFVPYFGFGNTWFYLYGWQKGGEYLTEPQEDIPGDLPRANLTDPKLVEAMEWVREFTADYGVDELSVFQSGFGSQELDPFLTGQMAMIGEEVFMLSRIRRYAPDLDFGMAPLPWPEDGEHATWAGGFAFVLPVGTDHPKKAMDFVAYMSSKEAQAYYAKSSFQLPANKNAVEDPFFQEDPNWRLLIDEMAYARYRPVTPVGGVMWDELSRAWQFGGSGKMEPKEALERANTNVQAELDILAEKYSKPLVNWPIVACVIGFVILAALFLRGYTSWKKLQQVNLLRNEAYAGYIFSLPAIIGLIGFWIGPIFVAAIYSFCQYDVLSPARWTGFDNYQRMFVEDPLFWKSMYNTLYFVVLSVPLGLGGSLGLALLLNQKLYARSIWRTLFYLPSIVPLVALSLLFLWLFNGQFGLFNLILEAFGFSKIPWMTSTSTAKFSIVLMNLWTVGAGMIIFLAGLQGVPRQLYESAMIDGAGIWQRFRNVTLPGIAPAMFFMLVMNTIGGFQVFTQAYLMTGGTGAPFDSTLFYVFYLFRQGFEYFNMGYASALAWIMFLVILAVTVLQYHVARKLGYEHTMR